LKSFTVYDRRAVRIADAAKNDEPAPAAVIHERVKTRPLNVRPAVELAVVATRAHVEPEYFHVSL
jgi:hypothetical protein